MNVEIHPDADLVLRKQIERAVRPVHASRDRKLAMREELLAHLTAIYAAELKQQPNDQAALAAALERFGAPAALTAELNASVGTAEQSAYRVECWEDRLNRMLRQWLSRRPGETWLHFALCCVGAMALLNVPMLFPLLLVALVQLVQQWPSDSTGLYLIPKFFLLLTLCEAFALLGVRAVFLTLYRQRPAARWLWAGFYAVLWSLIQVVIVVGFLWSSSGTLPPMRQVVRLGLPFVPMLPPFLLLAAWIQRLAERHRQKHEVWTTLEIDE